MITTQDKFDWISKHVSKLMGWFENPNIHDGSFLHELEKMVAVEQDYADMLDQEAQHCAHSLFQEQQELKLNIAEADETKRVKKLRLRKTADGMDDIDFLHWAEGRSIETKGDKRKYSYVHHMLGAIWGVVGKGRKSKAVQIDIYLKTWRIVK